MNVGWLQKHTASESRQFSVSRSCQPALGAEGQHGASGLRRIATATAAQRAATSSSEVIQPLPRQSGRVPVEYHRSARKPGRRRSGRALFAMPVKWRSVRYRGRRIIRGRGHPAGCTAIQTCYDSAVLRNDVVSRRRILPGSPENARRPRKADVIDARCCGQNHQMGCGLAASADECWPTTRRRCRRNVADPSIQHDVVAPVTGSCPATDAERLVTPRSRSLRSFGHAKI